MEREIITGPVTSKKGIISFHLDYHILDGENNNDKPSYNHSVEYYSIQSVIPYITYKNVSCRLFLEYFWYLAYRSMFIG